MKRFILLFMVLVIPLTSAITTDLKSSYSPGETIIIEISGSILQPLSNQNIELRRNNVLVPFESDIKKISGVYYLWGIAPLNKNNFTLHIKNIATTQAGSTSAQDFSQNFTVTGNLTSYSINPGFKVLNLGENLKFTVIHNLDFPETINIDFPSSQTIVLNPGTNSIVLPTSSAQPGFTTMQFGQYTLPILLIDQPMPPPTSSFFLSFFPLEIRSILLFNETQTYPFRIINQGDLAVSNIVLNYNSAIFEIAPLSIPSILPNSSIELNLSLKSQNQNIYENISLSSGEFLESFIINITYTQNENLSGTPYLDNNSTNSGYFCSELSGDFCKADEVCSTQPTNSLDGSCCTGTCEKKETSSGSLAWLGWVIGILVVGILIWLGIKYKKSKELKSHPINKKIKSAQENSSNPLGPPVKPKLDIEKS